MKTSFDIDQFVEEAKSFTAQGPRLSELKEEFFTLYERWKIEHNLTMEERKRMCALPALINARLRKSKSK